MRRGFLYLVVIMDWHTRKVLAWRLSNTMEAEFCVEALTEAIQRFGVPEIMNNCSLRPDRTGIPSAPHAFMRSRPDRRNRLPERSLSCGR